MKKISIVGVEGSGKTVLMSVLGEKYAVPDKNGLSLKAKKGETFAFCASIVAALRKGQWPMATSPGEMSNLEWELLRYKGKSAPKVLGNVNVLDFAGEVYRQAFGIYSTVDESNKEDVEKLRRHVSQSDILIVLINLKDIIDGDRTHSRTIEMLWLSQSILDFAKKHKVKDIALVFSQADRYKALLEQSGGIKNAFKEFLPNVMYAYPNVSAFEVSAVDGTRIDDSTGKVVPACDFATTGLDELMLWIKDCISPRKFIMKMVLIFALAIITVAVGVLWSVYEKKRINMMNELKDKEFKGYVIEKSDKGTYYVKWEEGKIPPGNKNLITLKEEGAYRAKRLGYEWVPGTLTDRWVSGVRHERNSEIVSSEKEGEWISSKPGYSLTKELVLKWMPGAVHPRNNELIADMGPDQWKARRAGYVWNGEEGIKWQPYIVHPNNTNLVSDEKKDAWKSIRPGYVWVNGTDTDEWRPGLTHPLNEKLKSDVKVGVWKSIEPGYVWSGNAELMWKAGIEHLLFPHVFSSETEGKWHPESGFEWYGNVASGDYSVKWVEGKIIGRRKTGKHIGEWYKLCRECEGKGKVRHRLCNGDGNVKCDRCDGGRIAYKDTEPCMECDGSGKKRCPNECVSKDKIDTYLDTSLSCFFPQSERPEDFDYYIVPCNRGFVDKGQPVITISSRLYYNFNHGGRHGYNITPLAQDWKICPYCDGAIAKKCPLNHVTNGRWQSNGYVDCSKCENGVYEVEKYKDCSSCNYGRIKCNGCDDGYVNCSHCIGGWVKDSR